MVFETKTPNTDLLFGWSGAMPTSCYFHGNDGKILGIAEKYWNYAMKKRLVKGSKPRCAAWLSKKGLDTKPDANGNWNW